jgi:hypothetical protein
MITLRRLATSASSLHTLAPLSSASVASPHNNAASAICNSSSLMLANTPPLAMVRQQQRPRRVFPKSVIPYSFKASPPPQKRRSFQISDSYLVMMSAVDSGGGGGDPPGHGSADKSSEKRPSPEVLHDVCQRLCFDLSNLFVRQIDMTMYRKDFLFENRIRGQGRNSPNSYQNFIRISLPMSTTCLFST